jgi:tetratricopeptide (TPR) repeat protein
MRDRSFRSLAAGLAFALLATRVFGQGLSPDQIPMYGDLDRQSDPVLKGADAALIEGTTKEFGSRRAASERFVDQGFHFYFRNDLTTAMKRFNQGWLIDPENPGVFYGFMSVLNDRGEYCEARKMADLAFEFGLPQQAAELADAGRLYALCAVLGAAVTADEKTTYIKKASELYTQALKLEPGSAYVYGSWATASYWLGDYETAWRYVQLERKNGGKPAKQFLKMLKAKMPEPRR